MTRTTFLSNEALWQTMVSRVRGARHVDAAIAYFGQGGAKLLPLRRGDRLIVDMSPPTVRAGGTDPREVEELMQRGVIAFTRRNLHAKLIVADGCVMSGSANISKHSRDVLDEAAILTSDPVAIRRALQFIERMCTEPVRPEYLEECKRIYRPPRMGGAAIAGATSSRRAKHAKLWIVSLGENWIPESELERYEAGEQRAKGLVKDEVRSKTDSFHWSHRPKFALELELGDWVIQVTTFKDKRVVVSPPGQLLFADHYARDASGKERWVFHLEAPKRGEVLSWSKFKRAAKGFLGLTAAPRTRPVRDVQLADDVLALWTRSGRVSRR